MDKEPRRERFKVTPSVYTVFLNKENKVLLTRRRNTGYEDGNYYLPSGHKESGEYPSECSKRESLEEVGLTILKQEPRHIMLRIRAVGSERVDIFFVATEWEGEPQIMEPDKCDGQGWFPVNDLPKNTTPFIRFALERIFENPDIITYSEYGK